MQPQHDAELAKPAAFKSFQPPACRVPKIKNSAAAARSTAASEGQGSDAREPLKAVSLQSIDVASHAPCTADEGKGEDGVHSKRNDEQASAQQRRQARKPASPTPVAAPARPRKVAAVSKATEVPLDKASDRSAAAAAAKHASAAFADGADIVRFMRQLGGRCVRAR